MQARGRGEAVTVGLVEFYEFICNVILDNCQST